MKRLPFVKMHGAGNDYVYVDGVRHQLSIDEAAGLAARLADRHKGIGGDGLILLAPSEVADCRMVMWNADGSRGAMCGNGIRCLAKLAFDVGIVTEHELTVETDSGVRRVELLPDDAGRIAGARVDMGTIRVEPSPAEVRCCGRTWHYLRVDAGSPHAVVFVDEDPDRVPVEQVGAEFQRLPAFPGGVNVEFVQVRPPHVLRQRTFERGSGETLACGSGATAAAIAALSTARLAGDTVTVQLRGGDLVIRRTGTDAVMEGPAETVFHGEIEL